MYRGYEIARMLSSKRAEEQEGVFVLENRVERISLGNIYWTIYVGIVYGIIL